MTRFPTIGAIRDRARLALIYLGADVICALAWTALIIAIVLFSGTVSQFTYVDF